MDTLNVDLSTIKWTTLKRDQFLNHFLLCIEIAQQAFMAILKKHDHNLYFGVKKYTFCAILCKTKGDSKAGRV